jgi:hypothetical protein
VTPRFADTGVMTVNLPMMFTPAIGPAELKKLGCVLDAELLDR